LFRRTFGFALPEWRSVLQQCMQSPAEPPTLPVVGWRWRTVWRSAPCWGCAF